MPPRFYVPEARATNTSIELPRDEAAHLTRVLRLAAGDAIRVFNGRGDEWTAHVEQATKQHVVVILHDAVAAVPEARIPITLAVAVLKGEKMDDVVRDSVMLGVATIQPLVSTRTEITSAAIERSGRVARWQRIAVASAKQCGRAVVPEIRPAVRLDDVLTTSDGVRVMFAEPSAGEPARTLRDLPAPDRAAVIIGPEGGWTGEEVERAVRAGTMLTTLGTHTLRADAMPIIALTALRVQWNDF